MDTSSRLLRLLGLLQTHRRWSAADLADRLGVSRRTLRRDIDRLRDMGYTVRARRGAVGGYQLQAGADLPPLLLDEHEAVAIAVGLRTVTSAGIAGIEDISVQALAKLEQVLPARVRSRVSALNTSTVPLAAPGPSVDVETLTAVAQACRDQERLRFTYRARDGIESERRVEPHRLVPSGRRWYLVAWDLGRDDWRTFRVDRVSDPVATGWRFDARPLPAVDAAEFVAAAIAAAPARYEAVVTLHAPREQLADLVRHVGEAGLEAIDDETCRLHTRGDHLGWLAASIILIGVDFEVHEPPELVEHMATLAGRLAAAT